MAEKRFIGRRIAESDKIRRLANEGRLLATTLYAFLLPFLDKAGRMNANPLLLKGGMFEGYDWTVDDLDAAVRDLARVGLIRLYSNGKFGHLIQYEKFLTADGGFNTPHEKEPETTLPGPDDPGSERIADTDARGNVPVRSQYAAGKVPVQGPAYIELETETKTEVEKEHSSTPEIAPAPPALAATPPRETFDPGSFMEAWNANRGRLPAVASLSHKRKAAIRALVKEHGPSPALELLRDATLAVAADDFWISRQYGFDNLLTGGKVLARAEQWRAGAHQLGEGNLRLAANVERWAKALPEAN